MAELGKTLYIDPTKQYSLIIFLSKKSQGFFRSLFQLNLFFFKVF
jgi:hypothetical protein